MLATGTHVLIRVRDGITLRRAGDFLPDGSYLATISGGGITLTVRVIEYTITVAGRDTPELFCLITDLHDHAAYPARVLARAYHWRWIGSETLLKEAKSAISGAGPSTGPMLRSASPALAAQEHAAWVTAVELARAAARAAAAIAAPARKGRRAGQPVHPGKSHSPPPGGQSSLPSDPAPPPPACPPRSPRRTGTPSWPAWHADASRSTGTGTVTVRPRPARASRPAGQTWPPAPRQPKSASASPRGPDPGNNRRPVEPAAARSDSPATQACPSLSVKHQRDHNDPSLTRQRLPTTRN
jgi:hypothetical protein